MSVHFTRAGSSPRIPALPAGVRLLPGRADLRRAVAATVAAVLSAHAGGRGPHGYPAGVVVGTCGPMELGDEAVRAAAGVDRASWHDVGGVETYEE